MTSESLRLARKEGGLIRARVRDVAQRLDRWSAATDSYVRQACLVTCCLSVLFLYNFVLSPPDEKKKDFKATRTLGVLPHFPPRSSGILSSDFDPDRSLVKQRQERHRSRLPRQDDGSNARRGGRGFTIKEEQGRAAALIA